MFGNRSRDIETSVNRLYRAFKSTADRYRYTFQRPVITVGGRPNVVFLGNHSSGKSSAINSLLGDLPVQDTGVAPTDDCFTVILYGEFEQDYYGPAALGQLPVEFASLASMGPRFLQHLRVKFRKRDYLKQVNLIDSPGMIDSAEGTSTRSYDFTAAVRSFSEISDLVFFLFDPEKPGTTAEAVSVLSRCMFGIEFKLRVLLNKTDTFDSLYDFARAYGTLCWNLARVLRMKDIPTIYTTYTPRPETRAVAKLDLTWFDKHRGDILEQLRNVSQRRFDSMLANVSTDFTRLSIQSRVLSSVAWTLFLRRLRQVGAFVLITPLTVLGTWFLASRVLFSLPADGGFSWRLLAAYFLTFIATSLVCLALAVSAHVGTRRLRASLICGIDRVFEKVYAESLAMSARSDLRQYWETIRDDIAAIIQSKIRLPLFCWGTHRRLENVLIDTLPSLTTRSRKGLQKDK